MLISRQQAWLTLLAAIFLVAAIAILAVFAFLPAIAVVYGPLLLTAFIVALFIGMVCIGWLLRGLLLPYNQLVGEARRAPVPHPGKSLNEASFVLETFQSVVAQLQAQQKELERLSAQATERADSAERFSERIVASMPTGLVAFDAAGQATVINGPARMLLSDRSDNSGNHYRALFSNLPGLAEMVESCLADGRIYRRQEIKMVNGVHEPKRIGASIAPIDLAESGTRGALCLLTDLTEVMRLREQVALKHNLESLGEMSAGLAHEFKNAMAALHGYAQFLQSVDHNEQSKAAADGLIQEVRTLSDMTTAFLNFARPQPLQLEDVPLDELIRECVRELQPLFAERRVSGSVVGQDSLTISADGRMLRQALLNLLRNAAEAIQEDKTERRVTVTTSRERGRDEKQWVIVNIGDTGPGIPPSDLQKIFIPFFTTKSTGHGVGLALAHRVITEHGGTLTAANAPDGSAVLTLRLPMS